MKVESALYKPFGEQSEWLLPGTPAPETKGWIGERYDADAGLQYLNARYYDPELSLFLQPDWFEITEAGVGTNRFSYSFNDPVNKFDPGGNFGSPPSPEMIEKNRIEQARSKTKNKDIADWFSRQWGNLGAAWNDPFGALSGVARGAVQDVAGLIDAAPRMPSNFRTGIPSLDMIGAAQDVVDSCKGSSACNDYAFGQMTDAEQGGYLVGQVVTGVAGIAKAAFKGATKTIATNLPTSGRKFNQLAARGWNKANIDEIVNHPVHISESVNKATGNPATAYFDRSGDYIVRDNVTGDIVQMSDRFDPNFMPDTSIVDPYFPPE